MTLSTVRDDATGSSVVPFTKQMRIATREVHSLSDALINAKLGIALGSNRVWAEGLLVFYEVFKWLEAAMDRLPDSLLSQLDLPGIRRTELFEQDLSYYLGADWQKDYIPRCCVKQYTSHLENLEHTEPELLLAYAYHLYMGLLSGGQILRRKRALISKLKFNRKHSYEGLAVTEISGVSVYQLKKQITETTNAIADGLDQETRDKLIEQSKKLFEMNDVLVRSIEGTNSIVLWKLMQLSTVTIIIGLSAFFIKRFIT